MQAKSKAQELEFELNNIFKTFRSTDWEKCNCHLKTSKIIDKAKKTYDRLILRSKPISKIAEKLNELKSLKCDF